MKQFFRFCLLVMVGVGSSMVAQATHLRAGNIKVTRVSCAGDYTFDIVIYAYTRDFPGSVKFGTGGQDRLDFGDGQYQTVDAVYTPPIIAVVDNGGVGKIVTRAYRHTYRGPGRYIISYTENNRNESILNITNSVQVAFYMQTELLIDPLIGCDSSPILSVDPIDEGCTGVKWTHNPGAYDPDGDSLSYEIYTPKSGALYDQNGIFLTATDVPGYQNPNSKPFYDVAGIDFNHAREGGGGPPIFSINPRTGTLTWDAPGEAGEYNIAFKVIEWRKVFGVWVQIGFVERDMQIIIDDCKNIRPILTTPKDTCVIAGSPVTGLITAIDPDGSPTGGGRNKGDSVKLEAFSQLFTINPNPATFTPSPVQWQPTFTATQQAVGHFNWLTSCYHVRDQPYQVVFKATDNGAPPLATYGTWQIKVVAPPPVWNSIVVNPVTRSAQLSWKSYTATCANASSIQIWRKVDSSPFTPDNCTTGMPGFLGYSLIATVPAANTTYLDKTLATGAKYCYRLVAIFPEATGGGASIVSAEYCVPPIAITSPVMTNVTVDVTDPAAGQITIKWRSPFAADRTNFPKPYSFVLKRADGLSGVINVKPVHPGKLSDSTFTDTNLNTAQNIYNYRVFAYASNGNFIDSSATASSVVLSLKPSLLQIELDWVATVPWSNNTSQYPYHLIYRGNSGATKISDLTLIDSVNVGQKGFLYLDTGQYNNTKLVQSQTYCYAVMTRGSYGNPLLPSPLNNYSEIFCTQPDDTKKPCPPQIVATGIDCSKYQGCQTSQSGSNVFSNTFIWRRPTADTCRKQIKFYNVYGAAGVGQSFTFIAQTRDTFYVHSNLLSFAYCYKVSSVDLAGKESALSESFCFDNCPYYELPNVFTPNGDKCNDLFSAFSIRDLTGENVTPCAILTTDKVNELRQKCARFVESVSFRVYNRWGREVYSYQSGGENSIYIDWNGKDNSGQDLDGAIYYYVANVVFDVVDPKKRNHTIKGWVHLIR